MNRDCRCATGPDDRLFPGSVFACLKDAMARGETMAWCVEHARESDPIASAWSYAEDTEIMRGLLFYVGLEGYGDRLYCRGCFNECTRLRCERCAAAIRALYPTLSLARVLEARRAKEAHR